MSLEKYIAQRNRIEKIFNQGFWAMHIDRLSKAQMQYLADRLAQDLSPECLTCDGELRGAQLSAKRALLNKAVSELQHLGQEVEIY